MIKITGIEAIDVRYPTSRMLDGSDAMNPDPDYSAAYAVIHTSVDGLVGHGMTFTIGRGNELCVAAINALAPLVVGTTLEQLTADMAGLSRRLLGESQLRWVGPEKGVVHLGAAAIINAVWDLWGKHVGKPVWQLVADLEPEALLSTLDLRHITDAITHGEALEMLKDRSRGKAERRARLEREGYPAYTTSAGWLGYPDDKILRLTARSARRGLERDQDQSGPLARRRSAPLCVDPRRARPRRATDGRRQPGVGGRSGDRVDQGARAVRPVVGRRTGAPR